MLQVIRLDLSWVDIHVSWHDPNHEFVMKTERQHQLLDRQQKYKNQLEEENDLEGWCSSNPAEFLRLAIDPDTILSFSTTPPHSNSKENTMVGMSFLILFFFFRAPFSHLSNY